MLSLLRTIGNVWAYVKEMLPLALVALGVLALCGGWRKKRLTCRGLESPKSREVMLYFFVAFCAGLAALTLFPNGFWATPGYYLFQPWNWGEVAKYWRPWELYPSRADILRWLGELGDVIAPFQEIRRAFAVNRYWLWFMLLGNIVMFAPLGFFPKLLWRRWHWWKSVLVGFCASFTIEFVQFFIGRSSDIDDVILNTAGALVGWLLARLVMRLCPGVTARCQVREVQ